MLSKVAPHLENNPLLCNRNPCMPVQSKKASVRPGMGGSRLDTTLKTPFLKNCKPIRAVENGNENSAPPEGWWDGLTAADIMTSNVLSVHSEDSIFKVMEILVESKCSGLAVVDSEMMVLGVISAYDVLALESTPGSLDSSEGFFPPVGKCHNEFDGDRTAMWKEFLELRKSVDKAKATKVGDGMHESHTVPVTAKLSEISGLIVRKHLHRVFVVDEDLKLVGVISRGDIMKATVENSKLYAQSSPA